jgi:hypothetical protein
MENRSMKAHGVAFLVLLVLVVLPLQVNAQQADLPSVDPTACTIEPAQLAAPDAAGDLNAPPATPTVIATDNASAADDDVSAGVIERIAQAIACQNAGDLPRMIANFSSGWIAERFSGYDLVFMQRFFEAADSPTPRAESERIELIAIENIRLRADGAALATVITRQPGIEQQSLLILVLEAGVWRIAGGQVIASS